MREPQPSEESPDMDTSINEGNRQHPLPEEDDATGVRQRRLRFLWLPIGVAIGAAIGAATQDMALWLSIGFLLGLVLALVVD